jgi:hypothetical protein
VRRGKRGEGVEFPAFGPCCRSARTRARVFGQPGDPLTQSRGEKVMHSTRRAEVVSCLSATHNTCPRSFRFAFAVTAVLLAQVERARGGDLRIQWPSDVPVSGQHVGSEPSIVEAWARHTKGPSGDACVTGIAIAVSRSALGGESARLQANLLSMVVTPQSGIGRLTLPIDLAVPEDSPILMASDGGGSGAGDRSAHSGTPSYKPFRLPDPLHVWGGSNQSHRNPPIIVPIPTPLILGGIGLIGVVAIRRRMMSRAGT